MIHDRPIGAALDRNLGSPTAPGEAVEGELDRLITRRRDARASSEDERPALEMWQESERRYAERRREENRRAWHDYFERLAACLRARAAEYDHRAQTLMEDQPKGAS